jgi:hypothetical protein
MADARLRDRPRSHEPEVGAIEKSRKSNPEEKA